ncbi:MAG: Protein phosphatase PP2A regulatory subunit B [Paramarteilia canceri]
MSVLQKSNNNTTQKQLQQTFSSAQMKPTTVALFVGNLHKAVTTAQLSQFISEANVQLFSARIIPNARSETNYGYINFYSKEDSEAAMKKLNCKLLCNRPIRMMAPQRDPSMRKSGRGTIIIKKLPKEVSARGIYESISDIGEILPVSLKDDKENPETNNAYIQFVNEKDAEVAVDNLREALSKHKNIEIVHFRPQKEHLKMRDTRDETYVNCYFKNLPLEIAENKDLFYKLFSQYGTVTSSKLVTDQSGNINGTGFICFSTHQEAEKACTGLNNKTFEEYPDNNDEEVKPFYIGRFMTKNERYQFKINKLDGLKNKISDMGVGKNQQNCTNLFIKKLDASVTEEALKAEFSKYGEVASVKIQTNPDGISKGFGFVSYYKPECAKEAIDKQHGTFFYGRSLYCSFAQKKSERDLMLQEMFKRQNYFYNGQAASTSYYMKNIQPYMTQGSNYFQMPSYSLYSQMAPNQYSYQGNSFKGVGYQMSQNYNQSRMMPQQGVNGTNYSNSNGHHENISPNIKINPATRNFNTRQKNSSSPISSYSDPHQLGNPIHQKILSLNRPDFTSHANKLTGMFLEMNPEFQASILHNNEQLIKSCEKAIEELRISKGHN